MSSKLSNSKEAQKDIRSLVLPIISENLLQNLAGLVSIALVGRLSTSSVSAQGAVMRITETFNALFRGIAIGGTVLIAHNFGADCREKSYSVFHQAVLFTVPLTILCAVCLAISPITLLKFLTNDKELLLIGKPYMRIIVCGFPFVALMAFVTSAFQGHSNTKVPMYIAIVVNIINIILGYIFIFGKLGCKPMGINGAGLAIVIAQAFGAVLGVCLLFRKSYHIFSMEQIQEKFFKFNFRTISKVYSIGIPAALESMFWQFSAIIMSKVILSYGSECFAAYQIGIQAESITEIPSVGFGIAATTLTAKAMGMKDSKLFKTYVKESAKLCLIISICTSAVLLLLPKVFMNIMTSQANIRPIGAVYVFIMGFVQIPQNLSKIYNGSLRSMGYKNAPMIISAIGIWLVRIPLALLTAYVFKLPLVFLWICIVIDQYLRFLISFLFYRKKEKEIL